MKNFIRFATVFVSLLLIAATFVSPVSAAHNVFRGVWVSTDIDGSSQTLNVRGGSHGTYHVFFRDDGATVCGLAPDGSILYAASARGTLSGSGDVISDTLPLYCLDPHTFNGNYVFAFTYDALTDTLTDSYGVIWYRR